MTKELFPPLLAQSPGNKRAFSSHASLWRVVEQIWVAWACLGDHATWLPTFTVRRTVFSLMYLIAFQCNTATRNGIRHCLAVSNIYPLRNDEPHSCTLPERNVMPSRKWAKLPKSQRIRGPPLLMQCRGALFNRPKLRETACLITKPICHH